MVDLGINIFSAFEDSGIKEARSALDSLEGTSNSMDVSATELQGRMEALDIQFNESNKVFEDANDNVLDTSSAVNALSGEFAALQSMSEKSGKDMEVIQNRLDASRQEFTKTEDGVSVFRDEFTGAISETNEAMVQVSNQVRTFNEEALSALFATMAVGRQMSELTKPAFEAAGVFDIISNTLKLFFLPIAFEVRDIVLALREKFLNIPTPMKKFIGAIVLGIGILAKFGAAISGVILNMGGIATLLFKVKAAFAAAGSAITTIAGSIGSAVSISLGPITAVIGAIIGAIILFKYAWDNNLGSIRQRVGGFVKWFGNNFPEIVKAVNPVLGTMDLLIKAVNRLFDKDIETLGEKFEGVGDKISGMGDEMIESGEKFDEVSAKEAKKEKKGFFDKHMPDVGPSTSTSSMDPSIGESKQTNNNVKNTFNIKTRKGQDERKIAEELNRMHKESKDFKTREV